MAPKWYLVNLMGIKRFPWLFSVLWLGMFFLMVRLGFWQLDRADEKKQLITQLNQTTAVLKTDRNALYDALRFETIEAKGKWDSQVTFYLENQFHQGQVGFHVYGIMSLFDDTVYAMVNRGWVADPEEVSDFQQLENQWKLIKSDWPRPGFQLGEQTLNSSAKQQVTYLTEDVTKKWLNNRFCQQHTGKDCIILPFIFKLNQHMPEGFVRDWKNQMMPPEKHKAYAVQWFTMSLVLMLLYLVFLRKNHATEN